MILRDFRQAKVLNLVDNAIKHGAGGGLVTVEVTERVDGSVLIISDRGRDPAGGAEECSEALLPP